jgi:NitT/TauT family transport system substrate-binding protein
MLSMTRRRVLIGGAAATFVATLAAPAVLRAQEPRTKLRLGVVPLLSSGPVFLAQARGFFDRLNLDVEMQSFADSALTIPALVAGELDVTVATSNAGLFNAMSRGAGYKMIVDRGSERPGSGGMHIVASNAMIAAGCDGVDKMGLLRGKRLAIQAPGSIDQYLLGRGVEKCALNPRDDVVWSAGLAYPDIIRAIGSGLADAANVPVPIAFLAERNNVGKIITPSWAIEPSAQLACQAMPDEFVAKNRSAAIRFCMAHIYAARLYNKAAAEKDPDVIHILNQATHIPEPLILEAAPRWTWFNEDGIPNVQSILAQSRFWNQMRLFNGTLTEAQVFDLSPAREAAARLAQNNPFG